MSSKPKAEAAAPQEAKFAKEQLLASKAFRDDRDLLGALLKDNQKYSIADVRSALEKFKKGKVK